MSAHTLALATVLTVGVGGDAMAQACPLVGTLVPVKTRFVVGEPIELELRFTNGGIAPAGVGLQYPSLIDEGTPCLRFATPSATGGATPERRTMEERLLIQQVAPRSTWSLRTHLQRFVPTPGTGNREIHYELAFPCYSAKSQLLADKAAGAGILRFVVEKGDSVELSAAIGRYAQRLSSTDFWEQRTAVDALSLVDDPAVIPFLKEMNALGLTEDALAALGRWKGNPTAEAVVFTALHSARADAVGQALAVLEKWQRVLPPDALRDVLARGNAPTRVAALRYVQAVHSEAYVPLLEPYISDENASVVLEARKARELLLAEPR